MKVVSKIEQLNLSVRAYKVCVASGFLNAKDIAIYYERYGNFIRLRNCGKKTEEELTRIVHDFNNDVPPVIVERPERQILTEPIKPFQKQLLSKYFKYNIIRLSHGARKIMISIFEHKNEDIEKVIEYLESIDFDYAQIRGIGKKYFIELDAFWVDFFNFFDKVTSLSHKKLLYEILVREIKDTLNDSKKVSDWLNGQMNNYLQYEFPIIRLIKLVLENNIVLSGRSLYLLKFHSKYFLGYNSRTLSESASIFGITRERIRQLSLPEKLIHPLWKTIQEIVTIIQPKYISIKDLENYGDKLLIIDAKKINIHHFANFSPFFYYELYEFILKDEYTCIIKTKDNYKKYLVKKEIAEVFNFQRIFNLVKNVIETKNEKDCFLNLKKLVIENVDSSQLEQCDVDIKVIVGICEAIIRKDFGLSINTEGKILIRRTSRKRIHEYIIDILEEANKPLHINELYSRLEKEPVKITKSTDSLRAQLQNHRDLFINTALSTYGLKKWEDEGRYIDGTIKDLVEIYLRKFDRPKHIYDIASFITQHRDTNKHNIFNNLKLDSKDRFIIFDFGFIGLTSMNYDKTKTVFKSMLPIRNLEKDYFKENKSIIPLDAIKKDFIKKHKVEEGQFLSSIEDKINHKRYYIENGYLYKGVGRK